MRQYFAAEKKFGSRDRKIVSHLCYCFFRIGHFAVSLPVDQRIIAALFLCSSQPDKILEELHPAWNERISLPAREKLSEVSREGGVADIFPFPFELSTGIDREAFILSHLIQPDLFLRIRPGKEPQVKQQLTDAGIKFDMIDEHCVALANATKLDGVVTLNRDLVVQDYSSQQTALLMKAALKNAETIWDCCAASGGKSLLAMDLSPKIKLTVSDVRTSILVNLKKRFKEAGVEKYQEMVLDLSTTSFPSKSLFDVVIADVPCSGSGTWSRSPENLVYTTEAAIQQYAALQRKIISNAIRQVKPSGYFLYITCSVFALENEQQVDWIMQEFDFKKIDVNVLKGYDKKADSMFAALLRRSS